MKINNYVKIGGKYVSTSEMTKEQLTHVSQVILDRFANKLGYTKESDARKSAV